LKTFISPEPLLPAEMPILAWQIICHAYFSNLLVFSFSRRGQRLWLSGGRPKNINWIFEIPEVMDVCNYLAGWMGSVLKNQNKRIL